MNLLDFRKANKLTEIGILDVQEVQGKAKTEVYPMLIYSINYRPVILRLPPEN